MPIACEEAVNGVVGRSVYLLGGDAAGKGRLRSIQRFDVRMRLP